MEYRVGAVEYRLRPGDSLYFDAEDEHDFLPITDHVKYLGLFVERGHEAGSQGYEGLSLERLSRAGATLPAPAGGVAPAVLHPATWVH
jgi:hypothetical protein